MYKAIGKDTGTVYGYADTRCDLLRNLDKSFRYDKNKTGIYPEALIITFERTEPNE
ncbi:hypothetical protein [Enterococcus plantarum]|uniref:hypothetical protein n=1 Tax=Enterococcus plantarum TaxID=1077675 RepID=UPI0015E8E560|nr:hypothetical protein [Enterococcus plantarum]